MATLQELQSAIRKADAAGDAVAAKRFADAIRSQSSADATQAMKGHMGSLEMLMARAGAKQPREPFLTHVGQSLKEMAIPAVTTAAGATVPPPFTLAGAMIGAGAGELMNQAMGVSGGSVIPEANVDKGRIALATAAPAVIPAVVGTYRGIKNAGKVVGKWLGDAMEPLTATGRDAILQRYRGALMNDDPAIAAEIIKRTASARQLVPGSKPTVAEAVSGYPEATGIAAYEKKIKGMEGISTEFAKRQAEQEAARSTALANIAKTPQDLARAVAARDTIAGAMYRKAGAQIVDPDATFKELVSRPSMQSVLKRAANIAREEGRAFKIGEDIAEQVVTSPIVSASGQPIQKTIPAQSSRLPVESLHDMKMAMDDLIKNPERFGIGAKEAAGIAQTQREFIDWIGKNAPDYDLARQLYRELSSAPNRMEVGAALKHALDSPLETAAGGATIPQSERAGILANTVVNAPRTVKNATGKTMFDSLEQVLLPHETAAVTNVTKDLARHQAAEKLAQQTQLRGTDAIPGNVGLHLPPMLSRPAMIANWALGKLGTDAETRIAGTAATQHLQPGLFADAIQDLPAQLLRKQLGAMPSRSQMIMDAILQRQAPYAAVTATELRRQ